MDHNYSLRQIAKWPHKVLEILSSVPGPEHGSFSASQPIACIVWVLSDVINIHRDFADKK